MIISQYFYLKILNQFYGHSSKKRIYFLSMELWWFFLDYFFHFLHILLIVWNLTGWMFKKLRLLHFLSLNLLWFFWIIVGFFYGFGYCPLTDYHWQIKFYRGEQDLPSSYITYLLNQMNFYPNETMVDTFVLSITILIYAISFYLLKKT